MREPKPREASQHACVDTARVWQGQVLPVPKPCSSAACGSQGYSPSLKLWGAEVESCAGRAGLVYTLTPAFLVLGDSGSPEGNPQGGQYCPENDSSTESLGDPEGEEGWQGMALHSLLTQQDLPPAIYSTAQGSWRLKQAHP